MTERQILVHAFSASQFYQEHSSGSSDAKGLHCAQIRIPDHGVHILDESFIPWIEGFFAENRAIEEYVSAFSRRDCPEPIVSAVPHHYGWRCVYTSPEILANSKGSILSAFGISAPLIEAALRSPTVACSQCGHAVKRTLGPLEATELILQGFSSQDVSIFATAEHMRLEEWAARSGFSLLHSPELSAPCIRLESGSCTPALMTRLGPVLRSLWSLPDFICLCKAGAVETYYSPRGWCLHCKKLTTQVESSRLERLLNSPMNSLGTPCTLERSLMLDENHSVNDLIMLPIADLASSSIPSTSRIYSLLSAFDLQHHCLSTALTSLPPRELAILSIAISIFKADTSNCFILVDLPTDILEGRPLDAIKMAPLVMQGQVPIVFLANPSTSAVVQTHTSQNSQPTVATTALPANADESNTLPLPPVGRVLVLTTTKLTAAQVSERLITTGDQDKEGTTFQIPLFPLRSSSKRTVAEELGILQSIAQLYASSVDARSAGLSERDFMFTSARRHPYLCRECSGLGVKLLPTPSIPRPRARPCPLCKGARFREPVASTLFRGIPYSSILNRSIRSSLAVLYTLHRCREAIQFTELLELDTLPLGMPIALLNSSESRRLLIIQAATSARPSNPHTIVIETPHTGLSKNQVAGIRALQQTASLASRCRWIEIT